MCTVSWLPTRRGYWLLFSRDERHTRARAALPKRTRLGSVRSITPVDGDFGGTWIGANEFGLTAALLNRYEETPVDPAAGTVSRGLLLRALLDARSARGVAARLVVTPLAPFQPFTVVATDPAGVMHLLDWDGAGLHHDMSQEAGLVRTSSGRDQRQAETIRARVWADLATERRDIAALRLLHRSHEPSRGPFSVCMHREEAGTQSLTEVRVAPHHIRMSYLAGAPCQSPLRRVRTLTRLR